MLERRIQAIKSAMPLTSDEAIIMPYRLQTLALVSQLEITLQSIGSYDEEISALAPQHPDYALFSCLPGAGPHLACWWRSVNNVHALPVRLKCKSTQASHR